MHPLCARRVVRVVRVVVVCSAPGVVGDKWIVLSVVVGGGGTPGPIPNPEAKPSSADGTALVRVWESRSPPTFNVEVPRRSSGGAFCFAGFVSPFSHTAPTSRARCRPAMARVVHIALPASTDHGCPLPAHSFVSTLDRTRTRRGRESAMYETNVTVVGRLATDVGWSRLGDGTVVANFRVASTERRYDRATGGWVDGEKLFVDVRCWRRLAENAAASLVKGDPVVVTGKLYSRNYEHEGQRRTAVTVEAQNVAADLSRCTVVLKRDRPAGYRGRGHGRSRSRTRRTTPTGRLPWWAPHRPTRAEGGATTIDDVAEFIYTMQKVRKAHGDKVILDDVTLNFLPGAKIGVVGPNGAGKSTVLKIMAGLEHANNGEAYLQPGATVGILQQEPPLNEEKTVLGNVEEGLGEIKTKLDRYNAIAEQMATDYSDELMEEFGELQEVLDHADAWEIDSQLEQAMDALRCPPPDAPVVNLSGGERRRVALCKLLLSKPDLLLLDEPTNHLDAESVLWLEQHLASYAGAVLAVTHDRYFLDNVAGWILEIDRGRTYPYEGNYSTYLEKKAERLAVQGRKDAKLQKRLVEELAWVRSGAKARQAKSRARLQRYEEMAMEAERHRKLDFEEIQIPAGPRLGNVVVEVANLDKGFDGRVLIKDLSFSLPRNGIVGVIGPNGVGKTTLFKTIVGLEKPDSGSVRVGDTVQAVVRRPEPRRDRPEEDGLGGRLGRPGPHQGRADRDAVARLRRGVRVQGAGPAEAGRGAVRRRAEPAQPGDDPQAGRQPDPARRADERPGRRDPRVAGERARAVPRVRGGDLPRPLVPGPGRDAHPGVGGHRREPGELVLVRGQLRSLREEQGRAAGSGGRATASCDAP